MELTYCYIVTVYSNKSIKVGSNANAMKEISCSASRTCSLAHNPRAPILPCIDTDKFLATALSLIL